MSCPAQTPMNETPGMGKDAGAVAVLSGHSTRTCGGFGGRRINGEPCSQAVPEGRERCPWHPAGLTPEQEAENRRELAARGGVASHAPKRAPGSAPDPRFDEPPKIIRWCERTAGAVARGEYTDYKGLEAQLKLARLALDALGIQALDQLDKLEALVRGRLAGTGGAA